MREYGSFLRVWLVFSAVCLAVIVKVQAQSEYPVINEFMALNTSDAPLGSGELLDEDDESSDWIEIYNPTDQAVDLGGWHLTDDPDELAKWSFPAGVVLRPGAFMVVFASGKDRGQAVAALHTNFKLSGQGEYLALVLADGLTVAHAYAPDYPHQLSNTSYGLTEYAESLVPAGGVMAYHVPTVADASLDWTSTDFDASNWLSGPSALGFAMDLNLAGKDVGDPALAGKLSVQNEIYTLQGSGRDIGGLADSFYYVCAPLQGDGELRARVLMVAQTHARAKAGVMIRETLDPGSKHAMQVILPVSGSVFQRRTLTNGTSVADEEPAVTVPFWVRIVRRGNSFSGYRSEDGENWDLQGSAHIAMGVQAYIGLCVTSHAEQRLAPAVFSNVTGSGQVATDLSALMRHDNASVWTRAEFNLDQAQAHALDVLDLYLRFQDGYVAYLNGMEVARHLAPSLLQWDSQATAQRRADQVGSAHVINLLPFVDALRPGRNVLAIQGLNDNRADKDFLLAPELVAASHQQVPQYFTAPTPLAPNTEGAYGQVRPVQFSQERGFYDSPFELRLSTDTEGANIIVTLDGSRPTLTNGIPYRAALPITTTTMVRTAAIKPGYLDAQVQTHTFIFVEDVKQQSPTNAVPGPGWPARSVNGQVLDYAMDPDVVTHPQYRDLIDDALLALPAISLVTDLAHLFDPAQGIYVNPGREGRDWERPVSVELIQPDSDSSAEFHINAGMRIRGGFSRTGNNPKHSFRLFFRGEYGQPALRFPLFGDEGVNEFENIDLRTAQNYAWSLASSNPGHKNTFVREVFCRDIQREMGQPYTRSRFYHLYLNGQYWGLYQSQERSEASYAEDYFGGQAADYDVVKADGYRTSYTDGTLDAWNGLWYLCEDGFATDDAYYAVQGRRPDGTDDPGTPVQVDINNLIDYMLGIFFTGNDDAPVTLGGNRANNFFAIRNVTPEARHGWVFFAYDNEHSLGVMRGLNDDRTGMVAAGQSIQHFNPQWLHQKLMDHPEYRMQFADQAQQRFFNQGVLTPHHAIALWLARAAEIDLAIIAESARWGDQRSDRANNPYTKAHWWAEVNGYLAETFFPQRTGIVVDQLTRRGLYPSIEAPVFHVNGAAQHGAQIAHTDQLALDAPLGTIWYTLDGSDPRLPLISGQGAITMQTLVRADTPRRVLVPSGPVNATWTSTSFNDALWTPGTGGVGYERGSGYEDHIGMDVEARMFGQRPTCYVRIPFELTGETAQFNFMTLKLRYDDGFVAYINGTEVQRAYANGQPQWNSTATGNHEAAGRESFDISAHLNALKTGQNMLALHGLNVSTTSSDFIISAELIVGQRTGATGGGVSPTAQEFTGAFTLTKSTQVKARTLSGSVWSALSEATFAVGALAESLRVTEIMYHPRGALDPNAEYIELQNVGPDAINLNLARFARGIDFVFPDLELASGEHVLVVKDVAAFADVYGPDLNIAGPYTGTLSNGGERIGLEDACGQSIMEFRYEDNWHKNTDGEGFSLTCVDPLNADTDRWSLKEAWRASALDGGSPGWPD